MRSYVPSVLATLWILLVSSTCGSTITYQALMYGQTTSSIGYNFVTLGNYTATPAVYPPNLLRGQIAPTSNFQIARVGDLLVIIGQMQYFSDEEAGGILTYNFITNEWATLPVPNLFQGSSLYAIAYMDYFEDSVFLVGNFQYTTHDVNNPLHQVALCDIATGTCESMGNGIPDQMTVITGITQWSSNIIMAYTTANAYKIVQWNGEYWTSILYIPSINPTAVSVGLYGYFLLSTGFGSQVVQPVTCTTPANSTIHTPMATYGAQCWNSLTFMDPTVQKISCVASTINRICVMYNANDTNVIACQVTSTPSEWHIITENPVFYCPMYLSETYIYVSYSNSPTVMVAINLETGAMSYLDEITCNYPPSCIVDVDVFWCECTESNEISIWGYDATSVSKPLYNSTQSLLYSILPNMSNICSAGVNIFASSTSLSSVDDTPSFNRFSVFNGSAWTLPQYPSVGYITPVCHNNATQMWVAYPNNTGIILITYYAHTPAEYMISKIPYTCPNGRSAILRLLGTADPWLFFQCDSYIRAYNLELGKMENVTFNVTGFVSSIVGGNGMVFFGGSFTLNVSGVLAQNFAAYNWAEASWVTTPLVNNQIYEMTMIGQRVYFVGLFSKVGSTSAGAIAGWNYSSGAIDALQGGVPHHTLQQLEYIPDQDAIYTFDQVGSASAYSFSQTVWFPLTSLQSISQLSIIGTFQTSPVPPHIDDGGGSDLPPFMVVGITIAGSVLATALVFLAGLVFRRFHVKKKSKKPEPFRQLEKMPLLRDYQSNLKSLLSDRNIPKINEDDVQIVEIIGSGGQGTVQKGRWKKTDVAIKGLNNTIIDQEEANLFAQEIKVMSVIEHKNIVKFLGVMISKDNKLHLVTELMDTDLKSVIPILSLDDKIRVAQAVANAMKYLHSQKLLHRDIKPGNVLLSKDGRCKVSDFGLSRLAPKDNNMTITQNRGTVSYMAPEVIKTGHYNEKADVYSFGIMLAEVIGNKNPFSHAALEWSFIFMQKFVTKEVTPVLPTDCPPDLYSLMESCISWEADERPSFEEIYQKLKLMRKKFNSLK